MGYVNEFFKGIKVNFEKFINFYRVNNFFFYVYNIRYILIIFNIQKVYFGVNEVFESIREFQILNCVLN